MATCQLYGQEAPIVDQISVSGNITDEEGKPFSSVSVLVKGTANGTQTNSNGNYSITANTGDILTFSYKGYSTSEAYINTTEPINISMSPDDSEREDVVVTAMGIERKKDNITSSMRTLDDKELMDTNNRNILNTIENRVSGTKVASNGIILRGASNVRGGTYALIVVDGAITPFQILKSLDANLVKSISVIKGLKGAALYGAQGANGVIMISTKKNTRYIASSAKKTKKKPIRHSGRLKVKNIDNKAEYVKLFSKAKTVDEAYEVYNKEKENHSKELGYYVDAYDYFAQKDNSEYKKGILNDIIKSEFENYELLRALGYKMEAAKDYLLASSLFKRVLLIRPKEAQSYRDLALVYQEMGKTQKAFELLNTIVSNALYEVKGTKKSFVMYNVAKNEINNLIQKDPKVDKSNLESFNEINTNYDVRVVIDWNRADTDMDLHVIDPSLEDCFFKNPKTQIGGEISSDLNIAYGPEEFTLRNGRKGDYYVKVNYANDVLQDDENPTFVKVTLYKNYGTPKETKDVKVVRLSKRKGEQIIAKLTI